MGDVVAFLGAEQFAMSLVLKAVGGLRWDDRRVSSVGGPGCSSTRALADLEETLASASPGDVGAVRLDEQGKLVIPPLSAEDIPAEANALRDELASMLPFVPIVKSARVGRSRPGRPTNTRVQRPT